MHKCCKIFRNWANFYFKHTVFCQYWLDLAKFHCVIIWQNLHQKIVIILMKLTQFSVVNLCFTWNHTCVKYITFRKSGFLTLMCQCEQSENWNVRPILVLKMPRKMQTDQQTEPQAPTLCNKADSMHGENYIFQQINYLSQFSHT